MKKIKRKLLLFRILGFIFLIGPVIAIFIINRDRYFATQQDTVNITLGAMLGLLIAVAVLLGKISILKGYIGLLIGFALIYLLNSIIQDLLLIYGAVLAGDTVYHFIFAPLIKKYSEIAKYQNEQYVKEVAKQEFQNDLLKEETKKKKKLGSV